MMDTTYEVPFVNYPKHYEQIWNETTRAIEKCLQTGNLILRSDVEEFEANLAKFLGAEHAIGVNSGTDAIQLSLEAVGVKRGDQVITVAHTFVATIATIVHLGAKPILVDIEKDTMLMDMEQAEDAIAPKTKAIIPVHLNGRMCDMRELQEVTSDIAIIEDAAQALGADQEKVAAGTAGDTGCFSFYPAKILGAAGDGGAVVTDDDKIAEKIRLLRDHNIDKETKEIHGYGYNSRLDNIQAALLNAKMPNLPNWIERRREIARRYHEGLADLPIKRPPKPADGEHYDVYQNYVIRTKKRNRLAAHLEKYGIETMVSWRKPVHKHEALGLNYSLPVTEEVSDTCLSLPIYPELENNQVQRVLDKIRTFYGR